MQENIEKTKPQEEEGQLIEIDDAEEKTETCLLYTSPSPRD